MTSTATKLQTLADWASLPPESRCELRDGQFIKKALPSFRHADVGRAITEILSRRFRRKSRSDGTGGWWLATEVSVAYPKLELGYIHDLAGWKRSRVPEMPDEFPVSIAPDWVCEVCKSTWKKDSREVLAALEASSVPWYWLVDLERENLLVYELVGDRFTVAQSLFATEGKARIKPFDTVEIDLAVLFGADDEAE